MRIEKSECYLGNYFNEACYKGAGRLEYDINFDAELDEDSFQILM